LNIQDQALDTRITNTSNNVISYLNTQDQSLDTRITNTSNNVVSFLHDRDLATSNNVIAYLNTQDQALDTRITNTSNNVISYLNTQDQALDTRITNTSNNVIAYLNTQNQSLDTRITNTSNNVVSFLHDRDLATSNNVIAYLNTQDQSLDTRITNTSNNVISYLNTQDQALDTRITNTSNNVISYLNTQDQALDTRITNTSNNVISFLHDRDLATSNNVISYLNTQDQALDTKINNTSNDIVLYTNSKINSINTDTLPPGTSNRFITNDVYNRNITFTGDLVSSNIITSNLIVRGDYSTFETTIYQTEKLEIINDTTATSFTAKQMRFNQNVAEFYNSNNLTLLISSNANVGINKSNPNSSYKLDVGGIINSSGLYINDVNITTTIENTSNNVISYLNTQDQTLDTRITNTSNNVISYLNTQDQTLDTRITNTSNNVISYLNTQDQNISTIINQSYCKKTTFYFTTSNSYIYNGITYYTYNIQLSKYIRYIQLDPNIKLYKFRIHTSLFDSIFNDATIRECDYLIMMSEINSELNVRAIGLPQDTYLQKIAPWKIVKTTIFDYITYISPIQNASILCTIIDEA
jgi:uncharacterized protein (UPF0297 family)